MDENELSYKIIGIAIDLHKILGAGLLESAYEHTFVYELRQSGLCVEQQIYLPLIYKDIRLDCGYRIDLMVEKKIIVEIKSVETLAPVHYAQTLTYLRLSGCKLGLLINFNSVKIKDGIHRIVNQF